MRAWQVVAACLATVVVGSLASRVFTSIAPRVDYTRSIGNGSNMLDRAERADSDDKILAWILENSGGRLDNRPGAGIVE